MNERLLTRHFANAYKAGRVIVVKAEDWYLASDGYAIYRLDTNAKVVFADRTKYPELPVAVDAVLSAVLGAQ